MLAYSLFRGSTVSSIPGWTPVNESLIAAIDNVTESDRQSGSETAARFKGDATKLPAKESPQPSPKGSPSQDQGTVNPAIPSVTHPIENSHANDSALLDLNQATQSELETLPGIGAAKAKAIIAYREQLSGYRSVDQLLDVKGIGPKLFERISSKVRISNRK
ncbi:ComEA family DNA-binding protein [Cohnella luojiensis]|uniref:ComEA family DNA-binding protein n=1 Tax=Cohnella luojiensis TaxID=652876 RepID=UPI00196AC59A|nr:helix-hairpin-helix domain-containing protein [Cohnella luojiensis]